MDMEQEDMQYLGFFGTCREGFKITTSWKKIFGQITLALLLPLSFIFLAQTEVTQLLFSKITQNIILLNETKAGTARYQNLSHAFTSHAITLCLSGVAYLIFFAIFSLLFISVVVLSTVACIYATSHIDQLTFNKVMSVMPKVWKRLMLT